MPTMQVDHSASRRIIAGASCPLCGGDGRPFGERDGVTLRICCEDRTAGGVLLSWPWASEKEYNAWYADPTAYHVEEQAKEGQATFEQRKEERERAADERLDVISALFRPALLFESYPLLDIGCCRGEFVREALGHGYEAHGIEPNAAMINRRDRHFSVGGWQDVKGSWSFITLFDVFEHLTRPAQCLNKLKSHLPAHGILVIEMPEWGCPAARREGVKWKHVRPRQHVCLYSEMAARELFERAGFTVVASYRPHCGHLGKLTWFLQRRR